jgi:hypothetical protein
MAVTTKVKNLSSSAAVSAGECWLEGYYVNSTSSGTVKLWHGTGASNLGQPISDTRTPTIGWYPMAGLHATAGIYADTGNTINLSFHIRESD